MFIIQPGQGIGHSGQPMALGLGSAWFQTVVQLAWQKTLQFCLEINQMTSHLLEITKTSDYDLSIQRSMDCRLTRWYTFDDDDIL